MVLFIAFHIMICVFLVCVILLQPGKADGGIGFGSSSQSIFGSKGASNFLTKTTSACAVLFLMTSFFLKRSRIREYTKSVIGKEPVSSSPATPATPGAAKGATDKGTTEKLQDAIKGAKNTEPNKAAETEAKNAKVPATAKAGEPVKAEPPTTKK